MVVTEDGLTDYLVCPMRYAFFWHYEVDARESRRLYRQYVRAGMSIVLRLMYEGRLNEKSLRKQITQDLPGISTPLRAFLDGVTIKYAASLQRFKVLAYNLPVAIDVQGMTFASAIDALLLDGDNVQAMKIDDLPMALGPQVRQNLEALLQAGLSRDIRDEIDTRGQTLKWTTLVVRVGGLVEKAMRSRPLDADFLIGLGTAIKNKAFCPRWHKSVCHSCGFQPVCAPKWASARFLDDPNSPSMIQSEIDH